MRILPLLLLLACPAWVQADDAFRLLDYSKNEFQPTRSETFKLTFLLPTASRVRIDLFTPDGDKIRQLESDKVLKAGRHALVWDGKDHHGITVPDEAYYPIAYAVDAQGKKIVFNRHQTGGEVIEGLQVQVTSEKNISFQLPRPARVLSRAGIKGGPMLRTLANWEPINQGKVVLRWDGRDADGLRNLRSLDQLTVMARAYELPAFSIITSGNDSLTYRNYREGLKKPVQNIDADKTQPLERDGRRIERHHYFPKDINLNPSVQMKFVEDYPLDKDGRLIIQCPCPIQVDLNAKDKVQLQGSLYEIAFFVDDEFVSEQEQGYTPFRWRWTPSGLSKGEHVLTVNVSGLRGEVGVKSLLFTVQ